MINTFKNKINLEEEEGLTGPSVTMTFYMPNGDVKEFAPMPQSQGKRVSREIRKEQLEQYEEMGITLKAVRRHG